MSIEAFTGLLILACISAHFFYRNGRKVRQANAATEFRAAFSAVKSALENPARTKDVRDILIQDFSAHNIAITTYRGNINWFREYRLKKAWQQYHSSHKFDEDAWDIPKEERLFMDCFTLSDAKSVKIYLKRIHKLLSFAKET